jgi:hypothetical protein
MLDCMGEPEDAVPATIRSVIQGCGEFGINHLGGREPLKVQGETPLYR